MTSNIEEIEERVRALEERTDDLENRMSNVERNLGLISSQVDQFGDYKSRSQGELKLMGEQISLMIDTCESLVKDTVNQSDLIRAKSVLRRLKNNRTRISKAMVA